MIILTDEDIQDLNAIIGEMPHKYAVSIIVFMNKHRQEFKPPHLEEKPSNLNGFADESGQPRPEG